MERPVTLKIVVSEGATIPTKAYPDDAGFDLYTFGTHIVQPHSTRNIQTGVAIQIPKGYWGHILSRSSTTGRYGVVVVSAVIDAGYSGQMFVQVRNETDETVTIPDNARIGQLVLQRVIKHKFKQVEKLDGKRGNNGFGSSGV